MLATGESKWACMGVHNFVTLTFFKIRSKVVGENCFIIEETDLIKQCYYAITTSPF